MSRLTRDLQGPLRFILQAASTLTNVFEKIAKVLGDIGLALPSFKGYAALFNLNDAVRHAMCLFFEDILDLYAALLKFFANRGMSHLVNKLLLTPKSL